MFGTDVLPKFTQAQETFLILSAFLILISTPQILSWETLRIAAKCLLDSRS